MKMIQNYNYCEFEGYESERSIFSDQIDSDVEAELYGLIHHDQNVADCDEDKIMDTQMPSNTDMKVVDSHLTKNGSQVYRNNTSCKVDLNENSIKNADSVSTIYFEDRNKTIPVDLKVSPIPLVSSKESKKRKSDSVTDSSLEISVNKKLKGKSLLETRFQKNTSKIISNSIQETKTTVFIESSDSDSSIIWCEPSSSKNDLRTNLLNTQDTIILSRSDSDNSDSSESIFGRNFNFGKNASMPNIKIGESSKDSWYVNDEDLYRSKKASNRYHDRLSIKCSNCKETGHVARSCPVPQKRKCFICGGEHGSSRCKKAICCKCLKKGHDARRCRMSNIQFCMHCNMKGHIRKNCPDIWRRYHLTTTNSEIVEGEQEFEDGPIYCYNCGHEGHFGGECRESRMYSSQFVTWPLVISYNNPLEMEKKNYHSQSSVHQRKDNDAHFSLQRNRNFSHGKIKANHKATNAVTQKKQFKKTAMKANKSFQKKMKELRKQMEKRNTFPGKSKALVKEDHFPRSPKVTPYVPVSENVVVIKPYFGKGFTTWEPQSSEVLKNDLPKVVREEERRRGNNRNSRRRRQKQKMFLKMKNV